MQGELIVRWAICRVPMAAVGIAHRLCLPVKELVSIGSQPHVFRNRSSGFRVPVFTTAWVAEVGMLTAPHWCHKDFRE